MKKSLNVNYKGNEIIFNGLLTGIFYYEDFYFIQRNNPNALNYKELCSIEIQRLDNLYFGSENLRNCIQQLKLNFDPYNCLFNYVDFVKYVTENTPLNNDVIYNIKQIYTQLNNDLNRIEQLNIINKHFNVFDTDNLNSIQQEIEFCLKELKNNTDKSIISN